MSLNQIGYCIAMNLEVEFNGLNNCFVFWIYWMIWQMHSQIIIV